MARSLWVDDKYRGKVNLSLRRNFPSQKALAEAVGLALSTVNNFFTGKPIDRLNFEEICEQLGLQWRDVADLSNPLLSTRDEKSPSPDFYVERPPIESLCYEAVLQPGSLLRIKAPLQMGKTLLMSRILKHAALQNYRTVVLNLRDTTTEDLSNLDKFLQWFCTSIAVKLELNHSVDEHWRKSLGNHKIKCRTYFEKYLLPGESALAIALDELDRLFPRQEIAGEFLGMLRTWHEDARTHQLWRQLRIVLLHTEVYTQLDINQSPFNAGIEIKLAGLSEEEVQHLAQKYELDWHTAQVKKLMALVGGHPYLVREAFEQIARQNIALEQILQTAHTVSGIYHYHLEQHWRNLRSNPHLSEAFKKIILADVPVELDLQLNPDDAVKLDELGLVKLQSNSAMPRYELYRQYFRFRLGDF